MHKQKRLSWLLFAGSVMLALLTALVVQGQINAVVQKQRQGIHEVPVVMATKDMVAGAHINATMVTVTFVPALGKESGALVNLQGVLGKIANQPIYRGQQIVAPMLTSTSSSPRLSDHVPPGLLAMSVVYNVVNDAGGDILPGDHVAILAVLSKEYTGTHSDAARIIAQNIQVLSAPTLATTGQTQANVPSPNATSSIANSATVVLAVTPQVAQQIGFVNAYGELDLLLQSASNRNALATSPVVTDSTVLGR